MTANRQIAPAPRADLEAAFARHRRELHVHCYRMLGSFDDAEDLVQETFARAWRSRATFAGGPGYSLRAWLYKIATNACLDALARLPRRVMPDQLGPPTTTSKAAVGPPVELPWLQPYPDALLDEAASDEPGPEDAVLARETIELAFLAAIQLLPPRQRAVLILRDVLGWRAQATADALELSVAAANSALQRARATLREHLPERRTEWRAHSAPTAQERELLHRYMRAQEQADGRVLATLLREDVRATMPPYPLWFEGRDVILEAVARSHEPDSPCNVGSMRMIETAANRQPAAAIYVQAPGDTEHRAFALTLLRIEDGQVAETTTFEADMFPAFGLAPTL